MKKTLLGVVLACSFYFAAHGQLVANYTFNNGSVQDSSGNGLHVTAKTTTDTTGTTGAINQAAFFNNAQRLNVAHDTLLSFKDKITIATWIRLSEVIGDHKIIDKLKGNVTGNFELDFYSSNLRFFVASGSVSYNVSSAMVTNKWYHVVATYDGTNAKLYIDGQPVATNAVTGNLATNSSPLRIGGSQDGGGSLFWGSMDYLKIYGNTLSSAEVNTLYLTDGGTLGIDKVKFAKKTISIYPNPATKLIHFSLSSNVQVSNTTGQIVATALNSTALDISKLPAGVYFATLTNNDGQLLQRSKIMKE